MAQTKPDELNIQYDSKADVLYLSFGDRREAVGIEEEQGVIVRVDPETDEFRGVTIIDFFRRVTDSGLALSLPLSTPHAVGSTDH
jgi:uncharacterized protein YuzE